MLIQLNTIAFTQESTSDRILRIAQSLDQRLSERNKSSLPTIVYRADLDANARYENDTIWLGQIQAEFQTDEDWMSIIYHEYWHYQHEGEFAIGRDSLGQILQWDTDQWYTFTPSQYRIERTLRQYKISLSEENLSFANRERLLQEMRKTLSQSQELPFIYAPSNLSLEEIGAYEAQLRAEQEGLYELSTAARNAILERIAQQKDTYQRRKTYEKRQGRGPDGLPLTP
ncbi:MAG: hypothetical protein AB8H47_19205 [Bacteroidia bacterium]